MPNNAALYGRGAEAGLIANTRLSGRTSGATSAGSRERRRLWHASVPLRYSNAWPNLFSDCGCAIWASPNLTYDERRRATV